MVKKFATSVNTKARDHIHKFLPFDPI